MGHFDHTIHDHHQHFGWDNSLSPVLEVEPGASIEFEVPDASGGQLSRSSTAEEVGRLDFARVNPVVGPVFVKGAKPGDVLEVEILDFGPLSWGWTGIIPGFGLLDEFTEPYLKTWDLTRERAEFLPGIAVPLKPFPGTIGVALAEAGLHEVVPPRQNGGNMDIRHLTRGTRLLLPVWVEGALFSVGDTHAAQGDGEVCGTAIEAPMSIAVRFQVHKGKSIAEPRYIVPGPPTPEADEKGYYVTTGFGPDLFAASQKAIRYQIEHLTGEYGLSAAEAYALCSVAVDLRISEVVDHPNWLVSAFLPQTIFRKREPSRSRWPTRTRPPTRSGARPGPANEPEGPAA